MAFPAFRGEEMEKSEYDIFFYFLFQFLISSKTPTSATSCFEN